MHDVFRCSSFDNFYVSDCNVRAYDAAQSFTGSILTILSPNSGNGATHLAAAIANRCNGVVLSAENFIHCAPQISPGKCLVVDGIGFWCERKFDYSLCRMLKNHRSLVFTGNHLSELPEELVAIVQAGPVLEIEKPDYRLRHWLYQQHYFDDDAKIYLEKRQPSSVREIIGFANRIRSGFQYD